MSVTAPPKHLPQRQAAAMLNLTPRQIEHAVSCGIIPGHLTVDDLPWLTLAAKITTTYRVPFYQAAHLIQDGYRPPATEAA